MFSLLKRFSFSKRKKQESRYVYLNQQDFDFLNHVDEKRELGLSRNELLRHTLVSAYTGAGLGNFVAKQIVNNVNRQEHSLVITSADYLVDLLDKEGLSNQYDYIDFTNTLDSIKNVAYNPFNHFTKHHIITWLSCFEPINKTIFFQFLNELVDDFMDQHMADRDLWSLKSKIDELAIQHESKDTFKDIQKFLKNFTIFFDRYHEHFCKQSEMSGPLKVLDLNLPLQDSLLTCIFLPLDLNENLNQISLLEALIKVDVARMPNDYLNIQSSEIREDDVPFQPRLNHLVLLHLTPGFINQLPPVMFAQCRACGVAIMLATYFNEDYLNVSNNWIRQPLLNAAIEANISNKIVPLLTPDGRNFNYFSQQQLGTHFFNLTALENKKHPNKFSNLLIKSINRYSQYRSCRQLMLLVSNTSTSDSRVGIGELNLS